MAKASETGATARPKGGPKGSAKGSLGNRFAMWRARRAAPVTGFASQPEPRTIGLYSRGKQLMSGNFMASGHLIAAPDRPIWEVAAANSEFEQEAHGFGWLDDLAAVGDQAAKARAQDWLWQWIALYGKGQGPGWTPDLTGRRLIRWINHGFFVLTTRDKAQSDAYYNSLSAQVVFLSWRWPHAAPGLPRFEALTGLISAGLALTGLKSRVAPAVTALALECDNQIDALGGISTRNPEELLEVFTLLTWAERALAEAGLVAPRALLQAQERIAPTLRALRHADGGLARFHGGGRGTEGRLDQALSSAGIKPTVLGAHSFGMGFARLAGGRTTLVVDAKAPPDAKAGLYAHASTTAMELTSGRRPLVVNCGTGTPFGPEWHKAGRATASHSTLSIDGYSSSRLGAGAQGDILVDRAQVHDLHQSTLHEGQHLSLAHNGWSGTHGLLHRRDLTLSIDGRKLSGAEFLGPTTQAEQDRFEQLLSHGKLQGIAFSVRFHLHPDVDSRLDMGGNAVSMALKSGEIWVLRHDGRLKLSLDTSVYLEKGRLKPRGSKQIVLSGRAHELETLVGWTLAKAQDTPLAIRDLDRDDLHASL